PGTFFVKTAKMTSTNAAYCQNTFYEAWRTAIQRYGIYNPWTKRGAIEGLLPHGPHNVRDVLATHILKRTGSYEQASYAIQDTPDMVAQHYGRFLPQDKSEIAARILNQVWEAALSVSGPGPPRCLGSEKKGGKRPVILRHCWRKRTFAVRSCSDATRGTDIERMQLERWLGC